MSSSLLVLELRQFINNGGIYEQINNEQIPPPRLGLSGWLFCKSFMLDVWQGFKCISVLHENSENVLKEHRFGIAASLEVIKL